MITLASLAQGQTLKIKGAPQKVVDEVRKKYPRLFDKNSSLAEIDQIVKELMKAGSFEKVTAYGLENGNILVEAQNLRRIGKIEIRGHELTSTSVIKDLLALKTGDRFERKTVMEAGERLNEFYGERGYFDPLIEVKFINVGSSTLDILFEIEEREPCRIMDIAFASKNEALNQGLQKKLRSIIGDPLTNATHQDIQKDIQSHFRKNRYLQARVTAPEIRYNKERTKSYLTYTIKDPYRYDHFFYGNSDLSIFDIYRAIKLEEVTLSSGDPVIEVTDRIKQKYLQSGYAHVQVKSDVIENPKKFRRSVKIYITEGPQVHIDTFEVTGRISRPSK